MARPELLIAAPLRIEAAAIRRGLRGESGATVLRTGMGPAKAKRAASAIVAAGPRAVAVAGFGGGLLDGQRPGDVVLGTGVLSSVLSSVGTTSCRIDGLEISLRALGFRVHRGMLASVNHVVRGTER
ncbi:MAG: hypothetical protein J2O49_08520, partial [Sciscionella sp.]|nr:hypothetical protein [Sciscionella sp.]